MKHLLPLIAILVFSLLLGACGSEATGPGPKADPLVGAGSLPEVESLRESSGILETTKLGSEADLPGPGAEVVGDELDLGSTPGALSWGIWRFNPGDFEPHGVEIDFSVGTGSEAYVGLADFNLNRWEFLGPFTASQSIPLDGVRHRSGLGNIYVAMLVYDGDTATVAKLTLTSEGNFTPTASLSADVTEGLAPLMVSFDASGSSDADGTVDDYEWDFDGDGAYNELGNGEAAARASTIAQFEYTAAAVYNAAVRVTDNEGAQDSASMEVTVASGNQSPSANLTADPTSGDTPLFVVFDATGSTDSDGTILHYDWDIDGIVGFNTSAEDIKRIDQPTTSTSYLSAIEYNTRVRVTDDEGAEDIAEVMVTAYGWSMMPLDAGGDVGQFTSLAVVNGKPAISYWDYTNDQLKYAFSSTPNGHNPADWSYIAVNAPGASGTNTSLEVVNGAPAISFSTNGLERTLWYARASTPGGTSSADWQSVEVDATPGAGRYSSLAVVDSNPAIAYYMDGSVWDLRYARASTTGGMNAVDWNWITVDSTNDTGKFPNLLIVNGNPAIAYFYTSGADLMYTRATTTTGSAPGDWQKISIASVGNTGQYPSMALIGGNPAVTYWDVDKDEVVYARSSTANGTAALDWTLVTVDGGLGIGIYTSLVQYLGKPAFCFFNYNGSDLHLARSSTETGGSSLDWSTTLIDDYGWSGRHASMAVINGYLAVSYYDEQTADLRYALLLEP